MTVELEFSLGPVQGFVAQARRTRDLWGGSFLLSLLSGDAMRAATEAGATIRVPLLADDPLYAWIRDPEGPPPLVGSIPNYFRAEVRDAEHARAVADRATAAVTERWTAIAEGVWTTYVEPVDPGQATRRIWDRQMGSFWNVRWVAMEPDERAVLARRKLWQTRWIPDEPGDKCTVMHDHQELSGFIRASGQGRDQDRFWRDIQTRTGPYDLRDGERLSSIALVKRLFPRLKTATLGWQPPDVVHWPSTVHLGAQPWLSAVARQAPDEANGLARALLDADDVQEGRAVDVPGVGDNSVRLLRSLDPRLWSRSGANASPAVGNARRALDDALDASTPQVSQFYALLLADGDQLGNLVRQGGGRSVSKALSGFTGQAPGVVADHDGVTVYAGGDDVLAMLPVPVALRCARALSDTYRTSFAESGLGEATLSVAVVFSHVRLKLMEVLETAHFLLDEVAKNRNGRDSLAAGVLKPGGLQALVVSTWEWEGVSVLDRLAELVALMSAQGGERSLSESSVHHVRSTLSRVCDWPSWVPGRWADLPLGFDGPSLIEGILTHDASDTGGVLRERSELIWWLAHRHPNDEPAPQTDRIGLDSLVLASFLADGWQEDDR